MSEQQTTGYPVDTRQAAKVEQAIRDVFEKRFLGRTLPYEQARELVWLERGLVEHVVWSLNIPAREDDDA